MNKYTEVDIFERMKGARYFIKVRWMGIFGEKKRKYRFKNINQAYHFLKDVPREVLYFIPNNLDDPNGSELEQRLEVNQWEGGK